MTVKRKLEVSAALPPSLRPARWRWFHTVGLAFTLIVGALVWLLPANAAAAAGQIVVDEQSAFYVRAILAGLALWVGYVVRGQPAWGTVICTLIAMFAAGQMVRAEYTAEVTGIPLSLLWINLAALMLLLWLSWRPSVHERLEQVAAERDALREEVARLRGRR